MSVAQFIQDAWNQQAKWLIVLRPLAWIYRGGFLLNKKLYQMGIKSSYQAPVPVMVIGNITVGGSGKTPLLIQLVGYLQSQNVRVGVISRGYGGKGPFPAYVDLESVPEVVGDEPCLIVQSTHVPMVVGSNRQHSIEYLLSKHDLDLIISDDGLQHLALQRQIEWIVLDQNRGLGNQKLLPEGYLREPVSRLNTGTVIEHA
ncbi:MAG: tetraacyldisaccharide 4'-kinase, partial [Acinetobacter sp.]